MTAWLSDHMEIIVNDICTGLGLDWIELDGQIFRVQSHLTNQIHVQKMYVEIEAKFKIIAWTLSIRVG